MFFSSKSVRIVAFAAAVFSTLGMASAQVTASGRGYLLRCSFKKGEVRRYAMTSIIDMGAQKQRMDSPFTMKVLSKTGDVAKIKMTIGPMLLGGKPLGQQQTSTVSVNSLGQPVGESAQYQQMGQLNLPKKAVRVGEIWRTRVNTNVMGMPMKVNGEFKLTGFKNMAGRKVAIIAVKIKGAGQVNTQGSGTTYVATSDGSSVGSKMAMTITVTPQGKTAGATKYKATITITRK